jgi:hypothetical protein
MAGTVNVVPDASTDKFLVSVSVAVLVVDAMPIISPAFQPVATLVVNVVAAAAASAFSMTLLVIALPNVENVALTVMMIPRATLTPPWLIWRVKELLAGIGVARVPSLVMLSEVIMISAFVINLYAVAGAVAASKMPFSQTLSCPKTVAAVLLHVTVSEFVTPALKCSPTTKS